MEHNRAERMYQHGFPAWWTGHVKLPNEILLNSDLSDRAVRVWALIFNLATRAGVEWVEPPRAQAAALIGSTERAFGAAFKELVEAGLGERKRRGLTRTNVYRVLPPRDAESGTSRTAESAVQERRDPAVHRAGASTGVEARYEELDKTLRGGAARPSQDLVQRKRDLAFDAMADATASDPHLEGKLVGSQVAKLRKHPDYLALVEQEGKDGADARLAVEIHARARAWQEKWPELTMTPAGLVKHWRRLAEQRPVSRLAAAEEAVRREREEMEDDA